MKDLGIIMIVYVIIGIIKAYRDSQRPFLLRPSHTNKHGGWLLAVLIWPLITILNRSF